MDMLYRNPGQESKRFSLIFILMKKNHTKKDSQANDWWLHFTESLQIGDSVCSGNFRDLKPFWVYHVLYNNVNWT